MPCSMVAYEVISIVCCIRSKQSLPRWGAFGDRQAVSSASSVPGCAQCRRTRSLIRDVTLWGVRAHNQAERAFEVLECALCSVWWDPSPDRARRSAPPGFASASSTLGSGALQLCREVSFGVGFGLGHVAPTDSISARRSGAGAVRLGPAKSRCVDGLARPIAGPFPSALASRSACARAHSTWSGPAGPRSLAARPAPKGGVCASESAPSRAGRASAAGGPRRDFSAPDCAKTLEQCVCAPVNPPATAGGKALRRRPVAAQATAVPAFGDSL